MEKQLSFYSRLLPLNRPEEKRKFFRSSTYNPVFRYERPAQDGRKIHRRVEKLAIDPSSPAAEFYLRLKKEFVLKAKLLENQTKPERFTCLSGKIFGIPAGGDLEFARRVLASPGDDFKEHLRAEEIKKSIEDELNKSRIRGWKVKLAKNMPSKMSIKASENSIYINGNSRFFPGENKRLLVHEIKVHLFRALNGARQKWGIFKRGTAGYNETEEGLAVFFETSLECCPVEQMKVYAGRLMAVYFALKKSFRESVNSLMKWFPEQLAYRFTERAKRGLRDTSLPGAFTKDIHYISGYRKIKSIWKEKDFPRTLFAGKISLSERDKVRKMIEKGILLPPLYLPHEHT